MTGAQWLSRLLTDVDALDLYTLPAALAPCVPGGAGKVWGYYLARHRLLDVQTGRFGRCVAWACFALATGAVYRAPYPASGFRVSAKHAAQASWFSTLRVTQSSPLQAVPVTTAPC